MTTTPISPPSRRKKVALLGAVLLTIGAVAAVLLWPRGSEPTVLRGSGQHHTVELTIETPRVGDNVVELTVTDPAGRPASVTEATVSPVMTQMGHAFPSAPAKPVAETGRYRAAGLSLPMAGPWSLEVTLRSADGVEELTFPIQVNE